MKHSDFYKKLDAIRKQELQELAAAIKAHEDKYIFVDCESDNSDEKWYDRANYYDIPIIHGTTRYSDSYDDYYVAYVEVNQYGVSIYGFRTEYSSPSDVEYLDFDDITPGHISYIIDFISETDDVEDVSITH